VSGKVASVLYAIALLLCTFAILNVVLPGFERERKFAHLASLLQKSDSELLMMKQNSVVRSIIGRLHGDRGKRILDRLFGIQRRQMYEKLNKKESYELYMVKILLQSVLFTFIVILMAAALKSQIFLYMAPITFILFIYAGLRGIQDSYKKRQNKIIKDLPNLISKMIAALEVGKPLTVIFREVSDRCDPLLADMLKKLLVDANVMPMRDALQRFARSIDLPVMYDFVSVTNIVMDKGFREAESDLNGIKNDLRELRKLSLHERTKGSPAKMNRFYFIMIGHVLIFLFAMIMKMFGSLNLL
jgi:Flp pilus assembly protein TadB